VLDSASPRIVLAAAVGYPGFAHLPARPTPLLSSSQRSYSGIWRCGSLKRSRGLCSRTRTWIYLQHVAIATPPSDFARRLIPMFPNALKLLACSPLSCRSRIGQLLPFTHSLVCKILISAWFVAQ
jgi:hypothetical protein